MNTLELRELEPGDSHALNLLMNHAFGQGRIPDEPKEEPTKPEGTIGLFEGTQLRAALTVRDFDVYWGSAGTRAMGGIAGVATWAEARGRGLVDRLLVESLVRMRAKGQSVSALYPFAWAFYRKYGWDWVGERANITLPLRELPKRRAEVALLEGDDAIAYVKSVYGRYAARHHGPLTTETRDWKYRLENSDNKQTYVYTAGDGGYLLWRYNNDDQPGDVREMLCVSPESEAILLGLLRDLGVQRKTAQWHNVPSDTTLLCHLAHWGIDRKTEPVFAARVVDVEAALTGLPADIEGSLTLGVKDEHAPWNDGVFVLTAEGGTTRCVKETRPSAGEVVMDIQALSQAVWGFPALPLLRLAGRVQVYREENAFEILCRILPATPVWHPNFF
jgi:predicted acetyltransferase